MTSALKPDECRHLTLHFGSGDYYLFCRGCGAWWVRTVPGQGDRPASELANRGVGSGLSGHARVGHDDE